MGIQAATLPQTTRVLLAVAAMPHLARPRSASCWQPWALGLPCAAVASRCFSRSLAPCSARLYVIEEHCLTCDPRPRHTFALDHIAPVAQLDRASAYEAPR
jgi:hypothetical protein